MSGTVLLRRSALGDVILLGAVTSALPGPVTVVTAPEWAPVAARLRGVTRVVPWAKDADPRELEAAIGPGRRIDLHDNRRSRGLAADVRLDKRSVRRRLWLLGLASPRPPVVQIYAEACGVRPVEPPWIDVPAVPRDRLVVAPGASFATKRWAPERFRAVVRAFEGPVTVIGGPAEADLCAQVAADRPDAQIVCERGFAATIDALGSARVALCGDTGPLHLAAACGAATVAVLGSTHPADGFVVGYRGEIVQRELWCRPCSLHGRSRCPLGHLRCLDHDADTVLAAIRRVWACAS